MVYQMLEKGYIASLDDELHKYIPEFDINNPFGTKSITLRLACMHACMHPLIHTELLYYVVSFSDK